MARAVESGVAYMHKFQNVFVQVFNKAAGLAIPEKQGYRFVAAKDCFTHLENRRFDSIAAIEAAAAEIYLKLFMIEPQPRLVPARMRNRR
jgi:hypothetical protein